MKILIEHPCFTPYNGVVHGGTEMFVYRLAVALMQLGHHVEIYASADSTEDSIRSRSVSTAGAHARGRKFDPRPWYDGLAASDHDLVVLNTSMTSAALLDPVYADLFSRSIYLNHNGSNHFVRDFPGRQLNVVLRYFRACGGRAYYLSERNRAALAADWEHNLPQILAGKAESGLKRISNHAFLDLDPFDGHFNQAVAVPAMPRAAEGYLAAIGRRDREKRLPTAAKLAKELGRELFVVTPDLGLPHHDVMDLLAGAECLLLPSRNETFSIVAFEAMCHGVPVSYIEEPPAISLYPSLGRAWGDVRTTTLAERQVANAYLSSTYTPEAMGWRMLGLMAPSSPPAIKQPRCPALAALRGPCVWPRLEPV